MSANCPLCLGEGTIAGMETGAQVRAMRMIKGLSLKRAAEEIGISISYLHSVERGGNKHSRRALETVRAFLGGGLAFPDGMVIPLNDPVLPNAPTSRPSVLMLLERFILAERFLRTPEAVVTRETALSLISAGRAELQRAWGLAVTAKAQQKRNMAIEAE
jgi:transcriptional regulator with XRE-family HTH domain